MNQQMILIAALLILNLLPVAIWLWLFLKEEKGSEPFRLIIRGFIFGAISTTVLFALKYVLEKYSLHFFIGGAWAMAGQYSLLFLTLLFSAFCEEMSKHYAALKIMNEDVQARNDISDGILYAVVVALGFSFIENTYYIWTSFPELVHGEISLSFLFFFLFRGIITMGSHAVFSGIFGYFYARAYIEPNLKVITRSSHKMTLPVLFSHIHWKHFFFHVSLQTHKADRKPDEFTLKNPIGHNAIELIIEGLWAAVLLHAIYNLLLMAKIGNTSLAFLVIPYGILCAGLLFYLLAQTRKRQKLQLEKIDI